MASHPELRQPSSPAELTVGPVLILPPVAHRRRARSPSPEAEEDDGGECQTPRSEESRIPAVTSCPPAPKKRRLEVSCKRRLPEPELFHVGAELLWRSFQPLDPRISVCTLPSSPAVKNRKRCCPNKE